LVSNLDKRVSEVDDISSIENAAEVEEIKTPVADFIFETETKEMEVGKPYEVNLTLVGKENVNLDAMETYIKYDSDKLTVSKLTTNKDLPEITKNSGIDTKAGLISSIFLWDIGEVYSIASDQVVGVLSFMVTPKVEGETEISLVANNEENNIYSTLLVESVTSNQLLFLSNKLEINSVN
jgi:hypothetical protein